LTELSFPPIIDEPLMQLPRRGQPAPMGVLYDTSLDGGVDQVLALAMLFGFAANQQVRVPSVSTSRFNLKNAAFLDAVARFFAAELAGDFVQNKIPLPIGMSSSGKQTDAVPAMLSAPLTKMGGGDTPAYPRGIEKLNDTADPVALMRNALTGQMDQNGAVILAGQPANLLSLLANPDARTWPARKVRVLTIAGGRFVGDAADPVIKADIPGFRKLLAEWPTRIVMAGAELNEALPFPGSSLDAIASWAPNHPVVDAYRAFKPMPYDAPTQALAAVLSTVKPEDNYFALSEPGTITVLDNGRTRFTPAADGRHHYLVAKPDQKERVLDTYVKLITTQPPPPPARGRRGGQPPAPTPPAETPPLRGRGAAGVAPFVLLAATAAGLMLGAPARISGQADEFNTAVRPVLAQTCAGCHGDQRPAGGMSVTGLTSADSLVQHREVWEAILHRLRAGDMPPPGTRRPDAAQMAAMTGYIERAFERADAATKPDPGRMTAHRLNRSEYTNTIRDLLGVRFQAEKDFPADDSSDGFDNIGDVLTVSPLLMERYLSAAERIARWALSTEIPAKPLEVGYLDREKRIRRLDRSTIEAEHRVEFPGEYIVRFGLPGERPPIEGFDAAPVTLGLWMDGTLLATQSIETKPSGLVYFNPYSEEEFRLFLPEGDHVFRAAFIDDGFVRMLPQNEAYSRRVNKFLDAIVFVGPFPSTTEKDTRKRILTCNPESGRACVEQIITDLARRAYRRPPTRREIDSLIGFVDRAVAGGQTAEQGVQLAIQAMLVSPNFLFRVERDPDPRDPALVHEVSPFELASRVSYFLWSSMPDDQLLALAESGKLTDPRVLAAQVDRMLADPRASGFAANFAGQWLETRNLDSVKPDPDKFKEWTPELREAMKAETTLFFEYVLRENRPVSDFLNANYTFLNERLAEHYGIDGVTGSDFRRVPLTTDRRGGVLSQAGVLTVSSYPTRTSPVIRGKYVLQNLLGIPPAPPPVDVPALEESAGAEGRSMREQLEEHRRNPTCAACHRNMDPLGFGLENYDAIGRWRDAEGPHQVDASGALPDGQKFATAGEMRALLVSQLPQFSRTLTQKMLTYALRRGLKPYDRRTIDSIHRAVAADGYHFRTLVHEIVKSLPFQARRGEDVAGGLR
jgi:mono/diheme cytochrome c family protein